MQAWLVCFDISDDRNRYRVVKHLSEYGVRVQKSVFEISVNSPAELQQLRNDLTHWLDEDDDLRFYFLCLNCRRKSTDLDGRRIAVYPSAIIL